MSNSGEFLDERPVQCPRCATCNTTRVGMGGHYCLTCKESFQECNTDPQEEAEDSEYFAIEFSAEDAAVMWDSQEEGFALVMTKREGDDLVPIPELLLAAFYVRIHEDENFIEEMINYYSKKVLADAEQTKQ